MAAEGIGSPQSYGITPAHWQAMITYAAERGYVLCVRSGKRAAVPWIERGFPAKPMAFKRCKVDPHVGLLLARTAEQEHEARIAGAPILCRATDDPTTFVAMLRGRDAVPGCRFGFPRDDWAREGIILDLKARLPYTSDYDLAAIVDTERPDYYTTYVSWAGEANRTNPIVSGMSDELNRRFGSRRIVHGSEAQYSGSLAHGDDDTVIAFHPSGEIELIEGETTLHTDLLLQALMTRYHPGMKPMFNQ